MNPQHTFPAGDDELLALSARHCDNQLAEQDAAQLRDLLLADDAKLALFVEYMHLHGQLHWRLGRQRPAPLPLELIEVAGQLETAAGAQPRSQEVSSSAARRQRPRALSRRTWVGAVAVALSVAVLVGWAIWQLFAPQPIVGGDAAFATLTGTYRVDWASDTAHQLGDPIDDEPLQVQRGLLELTLASGDRLIVEGPASIAFEAGNELKLDAGRVYLNLANSHSFQVSTPRRNIKDIGTKFGVEVTKDHELIQVDEGKVLVTTAKGAQPTELSALDAVQFSAAGQADVLPYAENRFVQQLPQGDDVAKPFPQESGGRLNQQTIAQVQVARAKWPVKIDGDLAEWPAEAGFTTDADPPLEKQYGATGWLKYDADQLYIAARVRDPHPLASTINPHVMASDAASGGSVQLRIAADRKHDGVKWDRDGDGAGGEADTKLTHLTMWYFSDTQTPSLLVEYRDDKSERAVNPSGFQAAFRVSPDGSGYTMECAISWAILRCEQNPPRAGDELPVAWRVTFSDASGRNWFGEIVDLVESSTDGDPLAEPKNWGTAKFMP